MAKELSLFVPLSGRIEVIAAGFHPRQRLDPPNHLRIKIGDRFAARIFRLGQRDLHREHIPRVESGIDILQANKALQQETRADQEDKRERDFGNNEGVADTVAPGPGRGAAAAFLEGFSQLGLGTGNRGDKAKKNPGNNGGRQGHQQHAQIEIGFGDSRDGLRTKARSKSNPQIGEQRAGQSADEGKQNAFGKHLPEQARRPGAKGDPNREFTFACSGPREQHGREIGAGNQEHERDRAEQNDQRRPHPADNLIVEFVERPAKASGRNVVIRKPGCQLAIMVSSSACAWESDTPGLSRPMMP